MKRMNELIVSRIEKLRQLMKQNGLSAYLINGSDPHLGEYVPDRWKSREYISGFSGSYGWLAITLNHAALWTDSRYYLQAGMQLEGTGIEMLKARLADTPFIGNWVAERIGQGESVGFDGSCYPASEVRMIEKSFLAKNIRIECQTDLLNNVWNDRPGIPAKQAFLHAVKWAGKSRKEKISIISDETQKYGAGMTVISALDDLCWTFNIRGADVAYNPVVLGYGIVEDGKAMLFVQPGKFSSGDQEELEADGIEIMPYDSFFSYISTLAGHSIVVDPDHTSYLILKILKKSNHLVERISIPNLLKSRKNAIEIEGMKKAMQADGIALLGFQNWLENALGKEKITEYTIAEKLTEYRAKVPGYRGDSFHPIIGYKDHGAIVHYHVSPEDANELAPEGVLLFDSGGQYDFGTTDITRTIMLGEISEQTKIDFTIVLKGMIALSNIRFPKGTIGCHLDVLAKRALWMSYMNYGHGTSHGVGAYLNVHEGPVSIRPDLNNQPVCVGNVLSNEPAFYREGLYGLRTENVMVCTPDVTNEYGEFLRFETLTLYPIDTRLIEKSLLDQEEINWINDYHRKVAEELASVIDEGFKPLLERLTKPI